MDGKTWTKWYNHKEFNTAKEANDYIKSVSKKENNLPVEYKI